jgi:hypothetical protein
MERHEESLQKARQHIRVAEHMLTVTYPVVQNPKILVSILENIYKAVEQSITSALLFERQKKTIPPFNDTFESKLTMFEMKVVGMHAISPEQVHFITQIRDLMQLHKDSPVEFSRKQDFVMCTNEYAISKINVDVMKTSIKQARKLIETISKVTACI